MRPIPKIGMQAVCGSRAILATMFSPGGVNAGPPQPPCERISTVDGLLVGEYPSASILELMGLMVLIIDTASSCLQHAGAVPMYPGASAALCARLGFCLLTLRTMALQHAAQGRQIPWFSKTPDLSKIQVRAAPGTRFACKLRV
jgi:hypothetical protein